MLKKAAWLLMVTGCAVFWTGCTGTKSRYVYAAVPAVNEVAVYREDPNSGVLTELDTSPYPAGNGAESVVVHPSGKYLYVANSIDNTISLFAISSNTGEITEVTPRTNSGSTPGILVTDPAGAYLYEADWGSSLITVYSIDSKTGVLTQIAGSPFSVGARPLNLQVAPSGKVLYVSVPGSPSGYVIAYSINAGVLAPVGVFPSGGENPYGLFVQSNGNYLFVSNAAPDNSIGEFSISPNGALTPLPDSPIGQTDGTNPLSLLIDTTGGYLFVANEGSTNISGYTVGSGGSITALGTPTFATIPDPTVLLVDPSGKYIYVASQSAKLQVFSLDPGTGLLTSLATYPTGSNITSLSLLP